MDLDESFNQLCCGLLSSRCVSVEFTLCTCRLIYVKIMSFVIIFQEWWKERLGFIKTVYTVDARIQWWWCFQRMDYVLFGHSSVEFQSRRVHVNKKRQRFFVGCFRILYCGIDGMRGFRWQWNQYGKSYPMDRYVSRSTLAFESTIQLGRSDAKGKLMLIQFYDSMEKHIWFLLIFNENFLLSGFQIFEFLYHLNTQKSALSKEYAAVIYNTLICVKNNQYFLQKNIWNRFISLKWLEMIVKDRKKSKKLWMQI